MRSLIFSAFVALFGSATAAAQDVLSDTLWYKYTDRFTANEYLSLVGYDSIQFTDKQIVRYKVSSSSGNVMTLKKNYYTGEGEYRMGQVERYIAKPAAYKDCDYTNEASQWCFQRSMESEHFICFWEKGLTKVGSTVSGVNIRTLLYNAERIWNKYVNELGFLVPGQSKITDNTKIHMYIVNQSAWRADGSGQDGVEYYYSGTKKLERARKVGLFHCNPQAATARGGHTPAHEIGHVFQYLVSADLGDSHGLNYGYGGDRWSGNCFWEDCANWQAYKVYPDMQFTDGEYYEQYMNLHHLNILNEAQRYANCFYHDYWCMKHGMNTIGRIWRESTYPEDPVEAYMRLFNLSVSEFADEMYEGFARMATWDIDGVRDYAKGKIGTHRQRLVEPSEALAASKLGGDRSWWVVDPAYCPENYGYNITPLNVPAAGTTVKATFRGIAGATGYRAVNTDKAGWRYGFVAYTNAGERLYGAMQSNASDGTTELVVPEGCTRLWFVTMGAPTEYWQHKWDDDTSNDEQWPYAVKFSGTDPMGALRTYGEFPADYARHDTTIVVNATLAYNASSYTSVNVQYDRNAISEALGLSTEQLKGLKRNDTTSNPGDIRFAGVNANGTTYNYNTTTTTSSATVYGHWFSTAGNVCGYDGSAAIFAELTPADYACKIGQYPGRLTAGKTYVIRHAVVYTHTDGKQYRAVIEVHLTVA